MPQYTNSTSQTALTFPYQAAKFQQKKKRPNTARLPGLLI